MGERRTDHYTWAELLRDLPAGAALVISVVLVCLTALTVLYFTTIRQTTLPTNRAQCVAEGHRWALTGYCVP